MSERKKILVAEDEEDIRGLVAYSLRYAGYEVIEATDGQDALDRAATEVPDLILLDVRMPKMNGYEVCSSLKTRKATAKIPVIFLSARGQESEIRKGLELGAVEYILKPFAPNELYRRVASVLDQWERKETDDGSA